MNQQQIKLGHKVKDIVSGVIGHVIGETKWLTGCDTVHIEPITTDGKRSDGMTLDVARVRFIDTGIRYEFYPEEKAEDQALIVQAKADKPGGPRDNIKHPNSL